MGHFCKEKGFIPQARPSIPVTCEVALAFIAGVLASSYLISTLSQRPFSLILLLAAFIVSLILILVFKRHVSSIHLIALFMFSGVLVGSLHLYALHQTRELASNTYEQMEFVISEDSKESTYGSQAVARVESGQMTGKKVLLFFNSSESILSGQRILAETRLNVPSEEYVSYYDNKALTFSARISEFEIIEESSPFSFLGELRRRLLNILGGESEEQTLLRAILLGERSALFDAGFYRDIKIIGLAHLVAVSGAHLVIVTGFIAIILRSLHLKAKYSVALQALFLVAYLTLVGFPLSCIRAAIMSAVTLFALLAKRRSSALNALGLTTLLMVLLDPSVVHQLSFQLSVASTLGIVLFMPLINGWIEKLVPKLPEFIRETLSMTLSALIFSMPISAAQFSTVPLISPLANLIATPYLTLLLMCGFIALILSSAVPIAVDIVLLLAKGMLLLFSSLSSVPGASIPVSWDIQAALVVTMILAILFWIWWPYPRIPSRRMICGAGLSALLVMVLIFGARLSDSGDKVVMLNVGQGDSFALMSGGKTLLIDTGNKPEMLYSSLARNNIESLDAVLITHPDDDHCGSLEALQGVVGVEEVIVAKGLADSEGDNAREFISQAREVVGDEHIYEVSAGDSVRFGKFSLEIVSPECADHDGENEDSICLFANYDGDSDGNIDWTGFFCGDAESEVLERLNDIGKLHKVDLYKVGHHGSKKSITPELAQVLSPSVALIGVGKNSYGHPREEIIKYLEEVNTRVHRSDLCGDTAITLFPDHVELDCEHE